MGDEQCRVDGVCDLIGQIQHKCVEYRESLDGSQSETRGGERRGPWPGPENIFPGICWHNFRIPFIGNIYTNATIITSFFLR